MSPGGKHDSRLSLSDPLNSNDILSPIKPTRLSLSDPFGTGGHAKASNPLLVSHDPASARLTVASSIVYQGMPRFPIKPTTKSPNTSVSSDRSSEALPPALPLSTPNSSVVSNDSSAHTSFNEDGINEGREGEENRPRGRRREKDIVYNEHNFWGLPEVVTEIYKQRKVTSFYEWQKDCLNRESFLNGKNLICSLPTSGGKVHRDTISLIW